MRTAMRFLLLLSSTALSTAADGHHHACTRPLGGATNLRGAPFSPNPAEFGADSSCCDTAYNRSYPTKAEDAWLAITMIMTSFSQLDRFVRMGNYATWVENVHSPTVVPVIFYPRAEKWFKAHDGVWQKKAFRASACQGEHAQVAGTACTKYVNDKSQLIITCPMDMAVSLLYNGNLQGARAMKLATFCGRGLFNGEYVVANKWFTYPMFLEPILSYFDFWAKFDVDVCFRRPMSYTDVIEPLITQRAHFFHAKLIVDNIICENTLGDFMNLYHHAYPCRPWRSEDSPPPWGMWDEPYNHPPVSFGNFIGGWLGFWQSKRVLHFAKRWWEWKGGWMHRWGDQQYWMPAMWMMNANDSVADLHHLRYGLFRHSKDYYPCGGGQTAEANETTAVFEEWYRQQVREAEKEKAGR